MYLSSPSGICIGSFTRYGTGTEKGSATLYGYYVAKLYMAKGVTHTKEKKKPKKDKKK
jgi:hypothetical protein